MSIHSSRVPPPSQLLLGPLLSLTSRAFDADLSQSTVHVLLKDLRHAVSVVLLEMPNTSLLCFDF
jgi:hypothetical protein